MDIEVNIEDFWELTGTLDDMASDICDIKDNQTEELQDIEKALKSIDDSLMLLNETLVRIANALENARI